MCEIPLPSINVDNYVNTVIHVMMSVDNHLFLLHVWHWAMETVLCRHNEAMQAWCWCCQVWQWTHPLASNKVSQQCCGWTGSMPKAKRSMWSLPHSRTASRSSVFKCAWWDRLQNRRQFTRESSHAARFYFIWSCSFFWIIQFYTNCYRFLFWLHVRSWADWRQTGSLTRQTCSANVTRRVKNDPFEPSTPFFHSSLIGLAIGSVWWKWIFPRLIPSRNI